MRVAIATCHDLPEPDVDEQPLLAALAARGVEAGMVAWDDANASLGGARLCVIRSTWNYHHRRDAFVAWAEQAATVTELLNPAPLVRWNSHKRYLEDLEKRGIAVVPTAFVDRGSDARLAAIMDAHRFVDVVVKPAVSAGSWGTRRISRAEADAQAPYFTGLLAERDVMVQPYLASVEAYGERSHIFIEGQLTHAIRKSPRFADGDESVSGPLPIADDERALAERIMGSLPLPADSAPLLYARVDLARDAAGVPRLMELELIEPSLFLLQHPPALERLADAIAARLDRQ